MKMKRKFKICRAGWCIRNRQTNELIVEAGEFASKAEAEEWVRKFGQTAVLDSFPEGLERDADAPRTVG